MKKILCTILVCFFSNLLFAQLEIGDPLPELELTDINGKQISIKPEGILVLDFWATSCGPCIPGLEKLSKLKSNYPDRIDVVAISHEPSNRIRKFQSKKDLNIQFVSDTAQLMQKYLPHHSIPHSVVVRNGLIIAITAGSNLTQEYFNQIIAGNDRPLPVKIDDMSDQLFGPYFNISDDHPPYFDVQPGLKGKSTFSQYFPKGAFAGRRIRCVNMTIDGLFRLAHETTAYRIQIDADSSNFTYDNIHNLYCVDFVVDESDKELLYSKFQEALEDNFSYNVKWQKQKRKVVVLKPIGDTIPLPVTHLTPKMFEAGGSHFKGSATIGEFAEYLEGFGILGYAVEEVTGKNEVYDIDFSFYPEDSQTFHDALNAMGLKVSLSEREIDVLVISEYNE